MLIKFFLKRQNAILLLALLCLLSNSCKDPKRQQHSLPSAKLGTTKPASQPQKPSPVTQNVAKPLQKNSKTSEPKISKCKIKVQSVISAEMKRGLPPETPANKRDPKYEALYQEESHSDIYLSCKYRILLNDTVYTHKTYFLDWARELSTEHCKEVFTKIEESIRSFTKNCTDLKAGEFWGFVLVPDKP